MGRAYFETERQEVIVHVPIRVYGKRVNGTTYEFTGHMPVDDDEVSQTYRQGGNINALKQIVLNRYSENRMHQGARVRHEASEEIWTYNAAGSWRVSVMKTRPGENRGQT